MFRLFHQYIWIPQVTLHKTGYGFWRQMIRNAAVFIQDGRKGLLDGVGTRVERRLAVVVPLNDSKARVSVHHWNRVRICGD